MECCFPSKVENDQPPAESLDLGSGGGRKAAVWLSLPPPLHSPDRGFCPPSAQAAQLELKIAPGPLEAEGLEALPQEGGGLEAPLAPQAGPRLDQHSKAGWSGSSRVGPTSTWPHLGGCRTPSLCGYGGPSSRERQSLAWGRQPGLSPAPSLSLQG